MLEKFETKSDRVKGLSFHPTRPWILAGLHDGVIQIWNYQMKTLVETYREHNGAVRGVHFHQTQPMFVSGGNDQLVRVWNYTQKKCLFQLEGHRDYIRTVFFHHEYPWILSASDDYVIRLWNWQSRSHITTLSGHLNYVFCAQFHPTEDLVLSASVDQTIRVWDISALREKQTRNQGGAPPGHNRDTPELFGSMDVQCKHELTGHTHGVNWAAFHPTLKQIVSVADDYHVKLWRLNEMSAGEIDTCRGHSHRVNSCLFHPSQDLILTCGMDKTIRVWDLHKRVCLETIKRDSNLWTLAAHSKGNLFAAGHDNGLVVFKLERERPAFTRHQDHVYYVKDRYVRRYNMETKQDVPLVTVRRSGYLNGMARVEYNPAEHAVILSSDGGDSGEYEVYKLPKDQNGDIPQPPIRGVGRSAVWVTRNRFVVLDGKGNILVKNLKNETGKTIPVPLTLATRIFSVGLGQLMLASDAGVCLFDVQNQTVRGNCSATRVKYLVPNKDGSVVALLSKRMVTLCRKDLTILCQVSEKVNVKSGTFDESGVFVYNTLNHVKYILPNGDSGIIRTLDTVIYMIKLQGNRITCVNRQGVMLALNVVTTEFKFKLALVEKRFDDVLQIVRNSHLPGSAIISYLQRKGYPEVALHRVTDDHTRFVLAKECGNVEIALQAAEAVDKPVLWQSLAKLAMLQGNHEVVEKCFFKSKNYDGLMSLYVCTGNMASLKKLMMFNSSRGDASSTYMAALLLGDVAQRHKVLLQTGQQALAYYTAKTSGNDKVADQQLSDLGITADAVQKIDDTSIIFPPTPVNPVPSSWPLLQVSRGFFDQVPAANAHGAGAGGAQMNVGDAELGDAAAAWGDDDAGDDMEHVPGHGQDADASGDDDGTDAWGGEDDDDLDDIVNDMEGVAATSTATSFNMPAPGTTQDEVWINNSKVPGVHVAAGSFASAMQLLSRQCGIVNFAPFKESFLHIMGASHCYYTGAPLAGSLVANIHSNWEAAGPRGGRPICCVSLDGLGTRIKGAYRLVMKNSIDDALAELHSVLLEIVLLVVDSRGDLDTALAMRDSCRNYITALTMLKLARSTPEQNMKRKCELAAYVTHCGMLPAHEMLVLRFAANTNFKAKNFKTARSMYRRILNLGPKADQTELRKRVMVCERAPQDSCKLDYDEYNPFVMCCKSFQPIYKGSDIEVSPLSRAAYKPEFAGQTCSIDQVAKIGAPGTLILSDRQK